MTEKDLRVMYKQETGQDFPDVSDIPFSSKSQFRWLTAIQEYIHWLENKIIELSNNVKF